MLLNIGTILNVGFFDNSVKSWYKDKSIWKENKKDVLWRQAGIGASSLNDLEMTWKLYCLNHYFDVNFPLT